MINAQHECEKIALKLFAPCCVHNTNSPCWHSEFHHDEEGCFSCTPCSRVWLAFQFLEGMLCLESSRGEGGNWSSIWSPACVSRIEPIHGYVSLRHKYGGYFCMIHPENWCLLIYTLLYQKVHGSIFFATIFISSCWLPCTKDPGNQPLRTSIQSTTDMVWFCHRSQLIMAGLLTKPSNWSKLQEDQQWPLP